jgi:excisionase family DNA binding protein
MPVQMDHGQELTLQQVAELKNVNVRTVRRMVAEGRLPAHRVGEHLIRVYPEDVAKLDTPIPTGGSGSDGGA